MASGNKLMRLGSVKQKPMTAPPRNGPGFSDMKGVFDREEDLRTMSRAHEISSDSRRMREVQKCATEKMAALSHIAGGGKSKRK